MAKQEEKTPEQLALEKKEKAEEAQRKKEQEQKKKEREKKKKKKLERLKKELKKENKRIKKVVNSPFKLLLGVSSLISVLSFIYIFFALGIGLYESLLYIFAIFSILYIGIGLIMNATIYLISEDKKFELEERLKQEEAEKIAEQKKIEEEELQEIEALEQEIAERREKEKNDPKHAHELPSADQKSLSEDDLDLDNLSLPENTGLNDADFDNEMMSPEKEAARAETPDEFESEQSADDDIEKSYFDELIAPELEKSEKKK